MSEITLRDATADDASFLAEISLLATRGHNPRGFYDVLFGLPDNELLLRFEALATTSSRSFHHYSRRVVAMVDGAPTASLAAFPGGKEAESSLRTAVFEVLSSDDLERMLSSLVPLSTCLMPPEEGAWTIEFVATLPRYRRLGLTGRLLQEAIQRGQKDGYRKANLQVEIGNTPAIEAYRAAGFSVIEEKRHPDFEEVMGSPGILLMSRPI
jgi:ribosomal protein S18 acetylase RimI-like enzyme